MPIQSCTLSGGGKGYKWGAHGHCYPTRGAAQKQAEAAYAHGYAGDAAVKLRAPTKKPVLLRATRPNAGIEMAYRRALEKSIEEMARSVQYWIAAAWRKDVPDTNELMAEDAAPDPNKLLRDTMRKLAKKWTSRFDELSEQLAERFADKSVKHTNAAMQSSLRDAGFTIKFTSNAAQTQAMSGITAQNVALIKSIPAQYFTQIEGDVWRSVSAGGDLAALSQALMKNYGVTFRRAALIARDQNRKAHAAIESMRRAELGLFQAEWMHSGAGKHPRPSHVQAGKDKLVFDVRKGAYLDGHWTKPGEDINCRCTSRTIIPGIDD